MGFGRQEILATSWTTFGSILESPSRCVLGVDWPWGGLDFLRTPKDKMLRADELS